ncbi:MAG: hypothetical protein ACRDA5_07545 [Clostridium sp.]
MDKKFIRGLLDFVIKFVIIMIIYKGIKSLGLLEIDSDIIFIGCIIIGDIMYWFIKKNIRHIKA